jgi:hypothetical protein
MLQNILPRKFSRAFFILSQQQKSFFSTQLNGHCRQFFFPDILNFNAKYTVFIGLSAHGRLGFKGLF